MEKQTTNLSKYVAYAIAILGIVYGAFTQISNLESPIDISKQYNFDAYFDAEYNQFKAQAEKDVCVKGLSLDELAKFISQTPAEDGTVPCQYLDDTIKESATLKDSLKPTFEYQKVISILAVPNQG
jgi:hypothetical protein